MPSDSRKPQAVVLVIGLTILGGVLAFENFGSGGLESYYTTGLIGAAVGFGTALGIVAFAWLLGRPRR